MKKFIFWPSIGLLTFIFTLLFSGSSIAQVDRVRDLVTENHPSISELENRYGKLILTDEFLAELEIAEMEQAIKKADSTAVAESFSDQYQDSLESDPRQRIRAFMGYFFRQMKKRISKQPPGVSLPGTFDFNVFNTEIRRVGPIIQISATIEFAFLTTKDSINSSLSRDITLILHNRFKRWKIKQQMGLFGFFLSCIHRISPNQNIPPKFIRLSSDYREPEWVNQNRRMGQ